MILSCETATDERRHQRRFTLGLPVRLQLDGVPGAATVELRDVSFAGCFLRINDETPTVLTEQEVALGFVLPSYEIGLAKGRVVRTEAGEGFAVLLEHVNDAFHAFVMALSHGDGSLAA